MKTKLVVVIAGLFIASSLCLVVASQENTNPTATPEGSIQTDVKVLQAQMDLTMKYNDKLLNVVYSTLGVVLLIVGLGWYANFRAYRTDLRQIQDKLKNDIGLEKSEMLKELRASINSMVDSQLSGLTSRVLNCEYELKVIEAESWERQGYPSLAIRTYAEILKIELKTRSWNVGDTLDKIRSLAQSEKARFSADNIVEVRAHFSVLPAEYGDEAAAILKLMDEARSKT